MDNFPRVKDFIHRTTYVCFLHTYSASRSSIVLSRRILLEAFVRSVTQHSAVSRVMWHRYILANYRPSDVVCQAYRLEVSIYLVSHTIITASMSLRQLLKSREPCLACSMHHAATPQNLPTIDFVNKPRTSVFIRPTSHPRWPGTFLYFKTYGENERRVCQDASDFVM